MTTPRLTTWAGKLTPEGDALRAYLEETGAMPEMKADPRSLLHPLAVWMHKHPDEATALWQAYWADSAGERTPV